MSDEPTCVHGTPTENDCLACDLAPVYHLLEEPDRFAKGDRVVVTEGLSEGRHGTVLAAQGESEIGVRMWRVNVDGHRERIIREDWLQPVAPEDDNRINRPLTVPCPSCHGSTLGPVTQHGEGELMCISAPACATCGGLGKVKIDFGPGPHPRLDCCNGLSFLPGACSRGTRGCNLQHADIRPSEVPPAHECVRGYIGHESDPCSKCDLRPNEAPDAEHAEDAAILPIVGALKTMLGLDSSRSDIAGENIARALRRAYKLGERCSDKAPDGLAMKCPKCMATMGDHLIPDSGEMLCPHEVYDKRVDYANIPRADVYDTVGRELDKHLTLHKLGDREILPMKRGLVDAIYALLANRSDSAPPQDSPPFVSPGQADLETRGFERVNNPRTVPTGGEKR